MSKLKSKNENEWVLTKREHSCLARTWPAGTKVRVYGCDPIRGYNLENERGEHIDEVGWSI